MNVFFFFFTFCFMGPAWKINLLRKWLLQRVTNHMTTRLTLLRGLTNHGDDPLTSPGMILQVYGSHLCVNCQGRAIKTLSEKLGGSALLQEKPILPGVETSGGSRGPLVKKL